MKAIILLGAPGAGKGTSAEGIKAQTSYVHVATGDMLRAAVKEGTEIGKEAEGYMKRGELVPDPVIIRLVEERVKKGSADDAYMFDGFPRTLEQARMLDELFEKHGAELQHVFFLNAERELLMFRLTGRRTCRACATNFHVVNIPPKNEGICDECGGELYQRPDDNEETISNRLDVFNQQTESLIKYYEDRGQLVRVDGGQHRDLLIAEIVKSL